MAVDGLVDAGVGLSEAEVVGIEDVLEAAGEFGIGAEAQAALDFVDVNSVGVAKNMQRVVLAEGAKLAHQPGLQVQKQGIPRVVNAGIGRGITEVLAKGPPEFGGGDGIRFNRLVGVVRLVAQLAHGKRGTGP